MSFQHLNRFSLPLSKIKCHSTHLLSSKAHTHHINSKYDNFIFNRIDSLRFNVDSLLCKRYFHSSNRNNALPHITLSMLEPLIIEIGAMIIGYEVRTRWTKLSAYERAQILKHTKTHKRNILVGCVLIGGFVYFFYTTRLVECPITRRRRFWMFSEKWEIEMAKNEVNCVMENYKEKIMKPGYYYNYVLDIVRKILKANSHLPGVMKNWQVIIINDSSTRAFVCPTGQIFIFKGLLQGSTQSQLAAIIGHEMAHVLLYHTVEDTSNYYLWRIIFPVSLFACCALLPVSKVFIFLIVKCIARFLFYLPRKRNSELEADILGLEMISRACFDPKDISLYWRNLDEAGNEIDRIEWYRTHPSHHNRYKALDRHMSTALQIFAGNCMKNVMSPHVR